MGHRRRHRLHPPSASPAGRACAARGPALVEAAWGPAAATAIVQRPARGRAESNRYPCRSAWATLAAAADGGPWIFRACSRRAASSCVDGGAGSAAQVVGAVGRARGLRWGWPTIAVWSRIRVSIERHLRDRRAVRPGSPLHGARAGRRLWGGSGHAIRMASAPPLRKPRYLGGWDAGGIVRVGNMGPMRLMTLRRASRAPCFSGNHDFLQCPGTELNRRHVDFQSTALPTELPGRNGSSS